MARRKLSQTISGRNRLDRRVQLDYRSRGGTLSTRDVVLYRVRLRRDGGLAVDVFDLRARAELTFSAERIERLVDRPSGRSWGDRHRILELLHRIREIQELTPRRIRLGRTEDPPPAPAAGPLRQSRMH